MSPFLGRETVAAERLSGTQGWWTMRPGFKLLSLCPQGTWWSVLLKVHQETEPKPQKIYRIKEPINYMVIPLKISQHEEQ